MSHNSDLLPILLYGLFQELVDKGIPIGVRDYLDGLQALQLGFGQGNRNELRELAYTLWARSDDERRLISHWFDKISQPPLEFSNILDQKFSEISQKPKLLPVELELGKDDSNQVTTTTTHSNNARVSFGNAREGEGLTLPRLEVDLVIGEEYILHPQTIVSSRDMAVLWRRYRRSTRCGSRTELDIIGTIRERCRAGLLKKPVYRARRRNSARLLILADVSPSMAPWLPFLTILYDSLMFGRFARAEMRYFINLPRKQLYANLDQNEEEPLNDVFSRFAGASLLIVSDGGSARGFLNRRRASQTSEFLSNATSYFSTIVWLNPMPRSRWVNTTAALIANDPCATTLPLESSRLLRVIDILRGNK